MQSGNYLTFYFLKWPYEQKKTSLNLRTYRNARDGWLYRSAGIDERVFSSSEINGGVRFTLANAARLNNPRINVGIVFDVSNAILDRLRTTTSEVIVTEYGLYDPSNDLFGSNPKIAKISANDNDVAIFLKKTA